MIWKNWNKADKTLLAAGAIFLFALCLHIEFKGNPWAAGFLFCAEAALVGGIADWFAVTALFEKPLGFPWHTAILPRRRQAFINATGKMLQKEFFGKKILIGKIKKLDFAAMVTSWLQEPENLDAAARRITDKLLPWLQKNASLGNLQGDLLGNINLNEEKLQPLCQQGIVFLREKAAAPEFKAFVQEILQKYMDSKLQGSFAVMLSGLAQSVNLLNLEEAAELVQKYLLELLDKSQQEATDEEKQLNAAVSRLLQFYQKNFIIKQDLKDNLLNKLRKLDIGEAFSCMAQEEVVRVQHQTYLLVRDMLVDFADLISGSEAMQREINGMVYQFAARGVLQAQELLGKISNDVLGTMTDEQINNIVYSKAEPDLLWIRMNGSIVGAGIGFVICVVMHFAAGI